MGGTKKFDDFGNLKEQTFKTVGITKNGIKILEKIDGGSASLPMYSNTPFTSYAAKDSDTSLLKQISVYGGKEGRKKIKDLDWSHKHTNPDGKTFPFGQIHVHIYNEKGKRSNYARKPSKKERRIVMMARYGG